MSQCLTPVMYTDHRIHLLESLPALYLYWEYLLSRSLAKTVQFFLFRVTQYQLSEEVKSCYRNEISEHIVPSSTIQYNLSRPISYEIAYAKIRLFMYYNFC